MQLSRIWDVCFLSVEERNYIYFQITETKARGQNCLTALIGALLNYQRVGRTGCPDRGFSAESYTIDSSLGCAVLSTFFYSLRSVSKRIWILFACVGIFANTIYSHHSLQHIRTNSHTKYSKIRTYQRIFASYCFKL